jgi:ABC-2 type transport system permease protein
MSEASKNSIEAEGLVREFRGGIRAVDGVDLYVSPGEIYGFLGPNGAGKSTTVHMLTTLLPPTGGTARVGGYDIVREGPRVRASIGAALQEAALDPFLTGWEHVKLQAAMHGLSRKERQRRGEELLERVGEVPGFDYPAGYTSFQYVWVLLQAMSFGGAFTGFSIARDFESGFARRLLLAAPNRKGIILGYLLASMVRTAFTGTLVTVVALVAGMRVLGTEIDLFGLFGLALLLNIAATLFTTGVALMLRTQQAGPLIQTPLFLALFLTPVFVPMELLEGWIQAVAALNPITLVVEGGRELISGRPANVGRAFLTGMVLVLLFVPWALLGLRRAERAG